MNASARRKPRLWVERLLITQSIGPLKTIRDIALRPGLNVVWAKEPESHEGLGPLQRAGHGVGKSTFCLMLRCILGDGGKAVRTMRDQLAAQFPHGGVGAVIHFGDSVYSVYRPFASEGYAAPHSDLESLLAGADHLPFKEYLDILSEAMLANLQQRLIPGSEQAIEWSHVLSWITRDQGTRLRNYFDWRSTEGTGVKRTRQDPPWILRCVLGLTNAQEMEAARTADRLTRKIRKVETEIKAFEGAPQLIRARIEANLRQWVGADADLELRSEDLFKTSVMNEVEKHEEKITASVAGIEGEIANVETQVHELTNTAEEARGRADLALAIFEEAEAMRDGDEAKLKSLSEQLSKLQSLAGPCLLGAVEFQACEHIKKRLETRSFIDGRDQRAIGKDVAHWTAEAVRGLPAKVAAHDRSEESQASLNAVLAEVRKLRVRRDSELAKLFLPKFLREEMSRWEDASGAASSPLLAEKRGELQLLKENLESAATAIRVARTGQVLRESKMTRRIDALAQTFGLHGRFLLNDDERPFELVGSAGEAYTVLEILLGDFACALDAADSPDSSFPAFLVHDCPREADLSNGLYCDYLATVASAESESARWQVIVTTTTPPPNSLRRPPHLALELHPEDDEGLLLRSRFGLQARAVAGEAPA